MPVSLLRELVLGAPDPEILADCLAQVWSQGDDVACIDPEQVSSRLPAELARPLLDAASPGQAPAGDARTRDFRALVIRLVSDPALLRELAEEALDAGEPGEDELALFDHPLADVTTGLLALAVTDFLARVDFDTGEVQQRRLQRGTPAVLGGIRDREQRVLDEWLATPPSPDVAARAAACRQVTSTSRRPDGRISVANLRLPTLAALYAAHPLLDHACALAILRAADQRQLSLGPGYVPEPYPSAEPHYKVIEAGRDIAQRSDIVQVLSRRPDGTEDRELLAEAVRELVSAAAVNRLDLRATVSAIAAAVPADAAGVELLYRCCQIPQARPLVAARTDVPAALLADIAGGQGFPVPGARGPVPLIPPAPGVEPPTVPAWIQDHVELALVANPVTPECVLRTLLVDVAPHAVSRLLTLSGAGRAAWAAAARLTPPEGITAGQWVDTLVGVGTEPVPDQVLVESVE